MLQVMQGWPRQLSDPSKIGWRVGNSVLLTVIHK